MYQNNNEKYFWQKELPNGHLQIGLNDAGRKETGEISFADFPGDLKGVAINDVVLSVESAKSVLDLYSPVSGKVAKVNLDLMDHPENLNSSDSSKNWILELYTEH